MGTLARLVHWHRAPAAGAMPWRDASVPLPPDLQQVLQAANGDLTALTLGAAEAGCAASEVRAAALRFVREVLLAPGADHYRRLGTNPAATADEIRAHYRELISLFHPDRAQGDGDPALAAAVNEAYNTLKRAAARAKYDRLRQAPPPDAPKPPPSSARTEPATPARSPRPRWHAQRAPGRAMVWLRSQAPARLKALAFAAVLGAALLAVLLAGARPAQTVLAMRADEPAPADATMPAAMPPLRRAAAPVPAGAPPAASGRVAAKAAAEPARTPPRDAVAVAGARAAAADAQRVHGSLARSPEPGRALPAAAAVAATEPPPAEIAEARPPVPAAPAPAARAGEPRPALADAAVELVIARFAAAYNEGDLAALSALIDPEVAQSERMLLTLASYGRVFQATTARRLDLRVLEIDAARGRVELALRATLTDAASARRTSVGTLTLALRQRGSAVVITDLACREADGA